MADQADTSDILNTEEIAEQEGRKKLTDDKLLQLSQRIYSELDMQNLCVTGLGMQAHVVAKCIHQNTKNLTWAMYDALKEWRNHQEDDTKAYTNLYNALRIVNMNNLICEVLERQNDYGGKSANPEIDSGKELTDVMLLRLALRMRVNKLLQIRTFLLVGLNIESFDVDYKLRDYGNFNLTMFKVLLTWQNRYVDKRASYLALVRALRNAEMEAVIKEVLEMEEKTEVTYSDEGDTMLTDRMIIEFSTRITEEIDLYVLGLIGLKLETYVVGTYIKNNENDAPEAMMQLLKYYMQIHKEGRCGAYKDLCVALRHKEVKLAYMIKEVLEKNDIGSGEGQEGDPVLNDAMIMKLALCVEDQELYLKLAESALKMQDYEIYSCLEKHKDLIMATQNLLHKWRNSQPDGKIAFKNLSEALKGFEDMEELVDILESDGTGTQETKFDKGELDRAYELACREGTKKVFNARMTLAGYHGVGKTSVATRLMGKRLEVEKSQSTEGIAMHRIKSKLVDGKWEKTKPNTADLWKDFTCGVLIKARKRGKEEIFQIPVFQKFVVEQII